MGALFLANTVFINSKVENMTRFSPRFGPILVPSHFVMGPRSVCFGPIIATRRGEEVLCKNWTKKSLSKSGS